MINGRMVGCTFAATAYSSFQCLEGSVAVLENNADFLTHVQKAFLFPSVFFPEWSSSV